MKDYVRDLRRLVGHRPLILPGASVVVVDPAGAVLLIERADTEDWGLPGGLMEPGESFEDTARREVFEETGLKVEDLELLGVFSGAEYFYRYPNGDEIFNVTAAYVARVDQTKTVVTDPKEARSAAYFPLDELPADVLAPERPILTAYLESVRQEPTDHQ